MEDCLIIKMLPSSSSHKFIKEKENHIIFAKIKDIKVK